MDNTYKKLCKMGEYRIISIARDVIKSNNNKAKSFTIAMGTYFFSDGDGNVLHNFQSRRLDNFIDKWDDNLYLTGSPMYFTEKGGIVRNW